jgi:translation initiation factor IF-3
MKKLIIANHEIRTQMVRIVSDLGSEVLPLHVAIALAETDGLDVVVINDKSDPPACKILDVAKYRYDMQRKTKEDAKAQREARVDIKEVQFKPNIDEHDFQTKCRKITNFISKGNKVKLIVQFRGRERQHTNLGYDVLDRVLETVEDIVYDGKPSYTGNRITAMLKGTKDGT